MFIVRVFLHLRLFYALKIYLLTYVFRYASHDHFQELAVDATVATSQSPMFKNN